MAGITALLDENHDLAVRAARAELERDALLAAVGRQGIVYDADGGVITAGPGDDDRVARALLGRGGTSFRYPGGEPVPPDDHPGRRALRGERLASCRYTIHDPGDEDLHVVVSALPIVMGDTISGAAVTWQDVTGEERACRHLAEANTLLEGLFENLGDIVGIQLPDHTILRYNRAGYEALGKTPEDVAGRKCYDLIGRRTPCSACATRLAVASKRREVVEKFVPEIGLYLECRSSPILDEKGEVAFIVEQLYDITDRKRTEHALRESEATARALLDAPADMIALLDTGGRLIDANDKVLRKISRSREELACMSISDLTTPDGARIYAARLREAAESGSPVRTEGAWEGGWYAVVFYPVRDQDGVVSRVAVIARDITERKRADDALRSLTHDLNERVSELSTLYAVSRIIERPEITLDAIFREVAMILPSGWQYPEDMVARIRVLGRGYRTDGFQETPWRQISPIFVHGKKVGTVDVCYLHEWPAENEGPFLAEERSLIDTIARRLGSVIERFQARESLEKSEAQFREITQQSFDMIYTCYHEGGIAYISPAVTRILGYTPAEIFGKKCRDFVALSSIPAWEEGREKIARGEPVVGLEIEFCHKDGSTVCLELNESPIVRELSVIGVHVVGRDITDRKQNEHLRQQAFDQIARNIEQFAILGDHIRQPLQVILGMSELVDEETATGRIREQVNRIN
ncbi:MAG: PAS domain S-box protein, partial [Methanoculleus sp.]